MSESRCVSSHLKGPDGGAGEGAGGGEAVHWEQPLHPAHPHLAAQEWELNGQCWRQGGDVPEAVHCEQPLQPAQPHRTSHSCVLKGQCWRQVSAATCVARIRRGARAQRAMSPHTGLLGSLGSYFVVKDRADQHIRKPPHATNRTTFCASRTTWGRAGVLFVPPCGYPGSTFSTSE